MVLIMEGIQFILYQLLVQLTKNSIIILRLGEKSKT
jgi:hypothetical protein